MNAITLQNGKTRFVSSSTARSVMGRVTRCSGCGYEQDTVMSYQQDRKLWEQTHTREFCRERKNNIAIDEHIERMFMR